MKKQPHKGPLALHAAVMKNQGGFALLLSLVIIFLLVVIILEGDFQARADLRAAGNFRDDLKAFYLARSAVTAGKGLIKEDTRSSNIYDGLDELWATPIPDYPLGDGILSGLIVDEERKINLNMLLETSRATGAESVVPGRVDQLKRLFELLEVEPNLVDPIIDWIDIDGEPQPFGAESGDYRDCDPAYCPKNGPLETLKELQMVQGISDEIYRKISPYLTIYGAGKEMGKINVNTADPLVLQSFSEAIDETEARRIMEKRPFESVPAFTNHLQKELAAVWQEMLDAGSLNWLTTRSDHFLLKAEGQVNNTQKTAYAVVDRSGRSLYFRIE